MRLSSASEVDILNLLNLRTAKNTTVTDHKTPKFKEILKIEDKLRELRRRKEEFKNKSYKLKFSSKEKNSGTIGKKLVFDTETCNT